MHIKVHKKTRWPDLIFADWQTVSKENVESMIVMGHKGKQSLKALHKDRDGFMPLLLLLGPTCVENYSFQLSLAKRIVLASLCFFPFFLIERGTKIDHTKAHILPHALFCRHWCESVSERTHQVRRAKGWQCQNSTVSGSSSAEQLLWCSGSREIWLQFFSALVERCMLGRLRHGSGFSRFNEGNRPVGKKKLVKLWNLWVSWYFTADFTSLKLCTL